MAKLWDYECDPYNLTATGWLGKRRKSMLENPLLVRSQLGKKVTKCLKVAATEHAYGYIPDCTGNVKQALNGWTNSTSDKTKRVRLPPLKRPETPDKDFKQINRSAIYQGLVEPAMVHVFSKSHTARQVHKKGNKEDFIAAGVAERPPNTQIPPDMVHGIKTGHNRLNEPIDAVMKQLYKESWMMDTKVKHLRQEEMLRKRVPHGYKKPDYTKWAPNRASMLRIVLPPIGVTSPPWRMARFLRKAKPHLSTFRSVRDQELHEFANDLDRVGHEGATGQGIYTRATNHRAGFETSKLEQGYRPVLRQRHL